MASYESVKKRKPNWTDHEVKVLLRVWKDFRSKLSSAKRNQSLYEDMSKQMELYGVFRDAPDKCLSVILSAYPNHTAKKDNQHITEFTQHARTEKTQELTEGTPSKWRFCSKINEILGAHLNLSIGYLDNNSSFEDSPFKRVKVESGQATILRLGCPQTNNENDISDEDASSEPEQSHLCNESTAYSFNSGESNWEKKEEENFIEELYQEYRETKESLMDTDKKILELLGNQNDLIKTQNDLCRTQNAILTSLLEKMK